jgi:hypothetical protein
MSLDTSTLVTVDLDTLRHGITLTVVTVVWYLLRQKDAKQAAEIKRLFELHDKDSHELVELRLHIAGKHYEAKTIDEKFEKLEESVTNGFQSLGVKFDKLSNTLIDHITKENNKC